MNAIDYIAEFLTDYLVPLALKGGGESTIYYIQAGGDNGPIKIGYSHYRENIERRLKDLQLAHYEELRLLAWHPGGTYEEARIHGVFDSYRKQGEWFECAPELREFIAFLREGCDYLPSKLLL